MDRLELEWKLGQIHEELGKAAAKERANCKAAVEWVNGCLRSAINELQAVLNSQSSAVGDVNARVDPHGLNGGLTFTYKPIGRGVSYEVRLEASVAGVAGAAQFKVGGQPVRTTEPDADILNYTQDQILADFLTGYASWCPE